MEFTYKNKLFKFNSISENDWIYKCIVESNSFYENDLLKYIYKIRRFINSSGNTIIDIGANIGMIKIDVEGMELDVLKGAKEILLKQRPHLFIEAKNNLEFQKIYNYLIKFKYIPMSVWAKTPVYHFTYKPSLILRIYIKYLTMNTKNEIQL